MAMPIIDLPRHKLADVIDRLAETIRSLEKKNAALEDFVRSLLNPEENGLSVSARIRDEAREALGMPPCEAPSQDNTLRGVSPMTVRELVAELLKFDQDAVAIVQKDAEGNGYSPLAGADFGWYAAENTWSGEVYHDGDDNRPVRSVPCVVIYPVN